MSIYTQMVEAGVEIDNHESDLYVPRNETTIALLRQYEFKQNCSYFINQINGDTWIDIPFAYDPWWDEKGMSGTYVNARTPNIDIS